MGINRQGVMVVEDDHCIREALSQLLELDGHPVIPAANGREALDALEQGRIPSLILLDLMMPVMNGWEFLKAVKEKSGFSNIPVIVLSATDSEGLLPGVRRVVKKPADVDYLMRMIGEHLA